MRLGLLGTLVLLGLSQGAAADGAIGAAAPPTLPGGEPAIEGPGEPAAIPSPGLDLRIDPAQLPASQDPTSRASATEPDRVDRMRGGDDSPADAGLSFGLEIKPRSRIGALARQSEPGDSGLGDQVERLLEQPVLGLRGRYRF